MPRPAGVGVIDLMVGIPVSDDSSRTYDFLKPLLMDEQSRQQFKMPAQYMFKDIPQVGPVTDKVGWTLEHMDRHGVERAMVGVYEGHPELMRAILGRRDRFLLTYACDPNRGMEEVRKIKSLKREFDIDSVNCFPAGLVPQTPINDKRLYPIYAACVEENLPIFINAGVCGPRIPSMCQNVELIEEVVWFFPELKFVMRHGAEPWVDLAVKLMLKYPNLYYCTSAFAPKHYPKEIIAFANSRGKDKIMYAGYFPMGLSLDRIFAELDETPLKDEVWPLFLRENALKLFGKA